MKLKWEYMSSSCVWKEDLIEFGQQGWELVSVVYAHYPNRNEGGWSYFFKRPINVGNPYEGFNK